jgi:enamine deaminase RidA (YjgF/YER057c/UK114 family)
LLDRVPARNEWGDLYGYSRAVRAGDLIEVAGTTGSGDSAGEQAHAALAAIADALKELGASMDDVVRTRMFVVEIAWNGDEVGQVHGEVFGEIKPATAMYGVTSLLRPEMLVEIEATAVVDR